ncbi:VIT1/CCC1 transporter family protein [Patescibacteria group bacterium]|nr:VIT1/CCC1 transporter family protein [Patescibacteria group bacterium]
MSEDQKQSFASYIRSFTFGVEDSLVSTVGLLAGLDAGGAGRNAIVGTGLIYLFVEAFSMAVGSFLSEHSGAEYLEEGGKAAVRRSFKDGAIMFLSFAVAGFIPLFPYLIADPSAGLVISIALSLVTLFVLGAVNAKFTRTGLWKKGLEMLLLGGVAIGVGVAIGTVFHVS